LTWGGGGGGGGTGGWVGGDGRRTVFLNMDHVMYNP